MYLTYCSSPLQNENLTPFLQRVVDMIDLQNMCSGSSLWDLAVITTETVYFYEDKESMTSGSCKSVPYSTMFSGFGDLPDIAHWKAVLVVSDTYVDVYTGISKLLKFINRRYKMKNCNSSWVKRRYIKL